MRLQDMSMARMRSGLACTVTTAAIIILGSLTVGAQAGETGVENRSLRSVYLVKYRVANQVRYTNSATRKVIKVSASQYRASNSRVCTPSGFGRTSRCYARTAIKLPGV